MSCCLKLKALYAAWRLKNSVPSVPAGIDIPEGTVQSAVHPSSSRKMASNSLVLGLTGLVFCTWAVSLAGIASIQDKCEPQWSNELVGITGFSAGLPCSTVFRYYWFIVALEFVLIAGLGATLATGAFAKTRNAWVGLFAVATLLYIQMSDTFLTTQSISDDQGSPLKDRVRTMVAGSIMTATVNCFLIIALGTVSEAADAPAEAKTIV